MIGEVAVDNDVLMKLAAYDMLASLDQLSSGPIWILGSARFVVRNHLSRDPRFEGGRGLAEGAFATFLESAALLEPEADEVRTAAELQRSAMLRNLDMDGGECLLSAMVLHRGLTRLATGDKRAIVAIAGLLREGLIDTAIAGRILCLEQLVLLVSAIEGVTWTRKAICAAAAVDRALTACAECKRTHVSGMEGLSSYIRSLDESAPGVLALDLPSS